MHDLNERHVCYTKEGVLVIWYKMLSMEKLPYQEE